MKFILASKYNLNIYDIAIIGIIVSNVVGLYGLPLTLPRIIDIFLTPYILSSLKNYKQYPPYVLIFFSIWLINGGLSIIWTPDKINGLKFLGYNFLSVIGFLSLIKFSLKSKNPSSAIIIGWVILFSITAPIAINEIINDTHLSNCAHLDGAFIEIDGVPSNRKFASVTFGNLNAYNLILVFCIPFILVSQIVFYKKKLLLFILLIALIYIIILNSSRGALLCLVIDGFIFLIYSLRNRAVNRKSVLILFISIILILTVNFELLLSQIASRIVEGGMTTDDGRSSLITNGIQLVRDSFLLGCGIGGLETSLISIAPDNIPALHNMFLEVMAEYGIVVFAAFICFSWKIFKNSIKRKEWEVRLLGWMFLGSLIPLSIINSGYLAETVLWIYFASFVCIACSRYGKIHF